MEQIRPGGTLKFKGDETLVLHRVGGLPNSNPYPTSTLGGTAKDNLIAVSIQFEYDPDDLATKITTQLVHRSNSKTYV